MLGVPGGKLFGTGKKIQAIALTGIYAGQPRKFVCGHSVKLTTHLSETLL